MGIENFKFTVNTHGFTDIIDITRQVQHHVLQSKQKNGMVHVFVPGSTVAVTTVEYEPGLLQDIPEALEKIAPTNKTYHHDEKWHDGNGYAHVRSAMLGGSLTIPLVNGDLTLGQWQQVVVIDFDNKPRSRSVVVQVLY